MLAKLSERFDDTQVKQRPVKRGSSQMLDYISIDATINRLNNVLSDKWSFKVIDWFLHAVPNNDPEAQVKWIASLSGELTALDKSAAGVGAAVNGDPDMAIKTALAEAIKKAGHQYGIGLYLWDEDERDLVAVQRSVTKAIDAAETAGDSLKALQLQVAKRALSQGAKQEKEAIAAHFGVGVNAMTDVEILKDILTGARDDAGPA